MTAPPMTFGTNGSQKSLRICVCTYFAAEMQHTTRGWDDVTLVPFRATCGGPGSDSAALAVEHGPDGAPTGTDTVVFGGACLKGLLRQEEDQPRAAGPHLYHVAQCFDLVAPPALVESFYQAGAYLISPGWLTNWHSELAAWGFSDQRTLREFFHEFATQLVLLDTGINPDSETQLAALAAYLDLPYQRVPVGLDTLRLQVERAVDEWRARQQVILSRHNLANYGMAMDILEKVSTLHDEADIVEQLLELFAMLYAPRVLVIQIDPGAGDALSDPIVYRCGPDDDDLTGKGLADLCATVEALFDSDRALYALTESGEGFVIRLRGGREYLGYIVVDYVAQPDALHHYLSLALTVTSVIALAISNARNNARAQRTIELEYEKEMVNQALRKEQELSALKSQFAMVASHEFRTPLAILQSSAQIVHRHWDQIDPAMRDRKFNMMYQQVNHLTALLDQMLLITRVDDGDLELKLRRTDVIELVTTLLEAETADARVVTCDLADDLRQIVIDPDVLQRIVVNLVSNALKFSEDHTPVRLSGQVADGHLVLAVSDNGIGIPVREQPRIFQRFFRASNVDARPGVGLGLSIVELFVQHLGGTVHFESEEDVGSTFTCRIPLAAQPAATPDLPGQRSHASG